MSRATRSFLPNALMALVAVFMVTGCSSPDARAQEAFARYNSAAAAGDLMAARQALLQLVSARDDVAEYWMELGKIEVAIGNHREAYHAFSRAYELDRTNVPILRFLTELAVRGGALDQAEKYSRDLEVLAPGDPWVTLAGGYRALSESRFDDAIRLSEEMLDDQPYDAPAKVLKARALLGMNRVDAALPLLEEQLKAQPTDMLSRSLLLRLYQHENDWRNITAVLLRSGGSINSPEEKLLLIQAALRSGNVIEARRASFDLLPANADPALISSVMDLWLDHWPSGQRVVDARALAGNASRTRQKLAYAAFLAKAGSPTDALRLSAPMAGLPVHAENVLANSIAADALHRSGRVVPAKALVDAILQFDPRNASALRTRAELHLSTGNASAAIIDARDLVAVSPSSPRDRLLLARCFELAGQPRAARRVLWEAFQAIPADESIYSALRARHQGASEDLRLEFSRQRQVNLLGATT